MYSPSIPTTLVATLDDGVLLLYRPLHQIAQRLLQRFGWLQEINPSELVHETYLKLHQSAKTPSIRDTQHLLALATRVMRQLLVDYKRKQSAKKRGAAWEHTVYDEALHVVADDDVTDITFEAVLTWLEGHDERMANVVRLRFLEGLKMDEIAHAMNTSERTVARLWRRARAHLYAQLTEEMLV